MSALQLAFECRVVIRAVRSEPDFAAVLAVLKSSSKEDLRARCPATDASILFHAAQRASDAEAEALCRLLVEKYKVCDPQHQDRNRQTALFFAARDGHTRTVKYLLSQGCSVNHFDSASQTALFYAARDGRRETVRALLDAGCNINAVDHLGQTALFYGSRDGRYETVALMLERGANTDVKDSHRRSALFYAQKNNHRDLVALLKKAAAGAGDAGGAGAGSAGAGGAGSGSGSGDSKVDGAGGVPQASRAAGGSRSGRSSQPGGRGGAASPAAESGSDGGGEEASAARALYVLAVEVPRKLFPEAVLAAHESVSQGGRLLGGKSVSGGGAADGGAGGGGGGGAADGVSAESTLQVPAPSGLLEWFEEALPEFAVWSRRPAAAPPPGGRPASTLASLTCRAVWRPIVLNICEELGAMEGGWIFSKPVDCRAWGCPDYFDVIKKPMDFSQIKKKLKSTNNNYLSIEEYFDDMELIFSNCFQYNRSETTVAEIGKSIQSRWRALKEKHRLEVFAEAERALEAWYAEAVASRLADLAGSESAGAGRESDGEDFAAAAPLPPPAAEPPPGAPLPPPAAEPPAAMATD